MHAFLYWIEFLQSGSVSNVTHKWINEEDLFIKNSPASVFQEISWNLSSVVTQFVYVAYGIITIEGVKTYLLISTCNVTSHVIKE